MRAKIKSRQSVELGRTSGKGSYRLSLKNIVDNASKRIQRLKFVRLRYDARAAWGRRPG
jgi:hypothetical protein